MGFLNCWDIFVSDENVCMRLCLLCNSCVVAKYHHAKAPVAPLLPLLQPVCFADSGGGI